MGMLLKKPVGGAKEAFEKAGFCVAKRRGADNGGPNGDKPEPWFSPKQKPPASPAVRKSRATRDYFPAVAPHASASWVAGNVAIQLIPDEEGLQLHRHASLGVVRLDFDYPPAPGDVDHPGSFGYDVFYRVVPGLTFAMCQSGKMPPEIEERFTNAVKWLDDKGVSMITGDCGFFINFQHIARQVTHKPVIMSTLCALPSITCAYAKHERIAIFTASGESLHPMRQLLWDECGIDPEDKRFVIVGCQDVPGFETVALGERVDVRECMWNIVKLAQDVVAKHAGTDSPIRAIVFECTELPPYSDAVRAATKLPVFDAITTCNSFVNSTRNNARFGVDDWHVSWDSKHADYRFGEFLSSEMKEKLVNDDDERPGRSQGVHVSM